MKAYLINLDRSPDRLEKMAAMFRAESVAYERVSAVDALKLTPGEVASACSRRGFFLCNARRVKVGEIACALSHQKCWRLLLDGDEARATCFEDDVKVNGARYAAACSLIEKDDDGRAAVWLLNSRNLVPDPGVPAAVPLLGTPRDVLTCWGTEAYVVNRAGAKRLLELGTPIRYVLDNWAAYARRGVDVRVVFPTPCGLCEMESQIERRTVGRAGWKWYQRFGWFKFRVAFHLDILCHRLLGD